MMQLSELGVYAIYEDDYIIFSICKLGVDQFPSIGLVCLQPFNIVLEPCSASNKLSAYIDKFGDHRYDIIGYYKCKSESVINENIFLTVELDGQVFKVSWLVEKLSLDFTYTPDTQLFRNRFTFNSGRHVDRFSINKIAINNIERKNEVPSFVYLNSCVVHSYSTLELGFDDSSVRNCLALNYDAIRAAIDLPKVNGIVSSRNNGVCMHVSLITASMHCYLYLGELDNIINLANDLVKLLNTNEFMLYYGPNSTKCLLLALLVAHVRGDFPLCSYYVDCISKIASDIILILEGNVDDIPSSWISEAEEPKKIHSLALLINKKISNNEFQRSDIDSAIAACLRVKSKKYRSKVISFLI